MRLDFSWPQSLILLPGWAADPRWHRGHEFAVIFGTMLGSMLAGFIGFIGAAPVDLYFKIVVNLVAVALLIALGVKKWNGQTGGLRSR